MVILHAFAHEFDPVYHLTERLDALIRDACTIPAANPARLRALLALYDGDPSPRIAAIRDAMGPV